MVQMHSYTIAIVQQINFEGGISLIGYIVQTSADIFEDYN